MKEHLAGKTLEELHEVAQQMGMPPFAAKQMARWLYTRRVKDNASMTDLSKQHRALLSEKYDVG